ncbi:MAG: hypothetical protein H0T79_00385 [Deltaproteobacteria bacterium]|nr:hypothetical protein [Deltaproteobacteria bacterium]
MRAALMVTDGRARPSSLHYLSGVASDPFFLAGAIPLAAISLVSVLGVLIGAFAVMTLGVTSSRWTIMRERVDRRNVEREKRRSEAKRLDLLRKTNPIRRAQYTELRALANQIEASGDAEVSRYALTDLLDYFVKLAVDHERHLEALRLVGLEGGHLLRVRQSATCAQIAERRRSQSAECRRNADRIADTLDAIEELVKLMVLRVECPELQLDLEQEIPRRLWELDELDRGMRQLTEHCAG